MRRTWVGFTCLSILVPAYEGENCIVSNGLQVSEHTEYNIASGQVQFLAFDMKIPYSCQMMTSVQSILRILTNDSRLVKKDGICAINSSCACPVVKLSNFYRT